MAAQSVKIAQAYWTFLIKYSLHFAIPIPRSIVVGYAESHAGQRGEHRIAEEHGERDL